MVVAFERSSRPDRRWKRDSGLAHGRKVRRRMYRAIVDYIEEHGIPPTIREIQEAAGLSSPSVVSYHLTVMEEAG